MCVRLSVCVCVCALDLLYPSQSHNHVPTGVILCFLKFLAPALQHGRISLLLDFSQSVSACRCCFWSPVIGRDKASVGCAVVVDLL